jgi:uncharacterized protein YkwD
MIRFSRLTRAGPLAATVTTLSLAALAIPSVVSAQGCDNTATAAAVAPKGDVRVALRCLINDTRAQHGLPALRASGLLNAAADRQSADMVARRYFAHVTPEGRSVTDRVRQTGYLSGSQDWALGEDIGWGTGSASTSAAMFNGWMNSPPHRRVILGRSFREIGVGIAKGVPVDATGSGATFVLDLGQAR